MRELLISAARSHYMGLINKHISNVEVLLTNPMGISGAVSYTHLTLPTTPYV